MAFAIVIVIMTESLDRQIERGKDRIQIAQLIKNLPVMQETPV